MQTDFMAMAQNAPTQEPDIEGVKEELSGLESLGLPEGKGKEGIKARLMAMLESMGVVQNIKESMSQQQFAKALDELATAMDKNDIEAIKNNPLIPIFEQLSNAAAQQQPTGGPAPQQQAAPTDFASMMPPGGGMGGR